MESDDENLVIPAPAPLALVGEEDEELGAVGGAALMEPEFETEWDAFQLSISRSVAYR